MFVVSAIKPQSPVVSTNATGAAANSASSAVGGTSVPPLLAAASSVPVTAVPDMNAILRASALRAVDGGLSGAAAVCLNQAAMCESAPARLTPLSVMLAIRWPSKSLH